MMTHVDEAAADPSAVARFWSKVDTSGDCWVWTASTNPHGYGQFRTTPGRLTRAHRFSYALHHGPVVEVVRHTCDNPPCVNPDHLVAGTQLDNIADMHARNRASGGRTSRPGEAHPNARLTAGDVTSLRDRRCAGESITALAAAYGISKSQASRIASGRRWAA